MRRVLPLFAVGLLLVGIVGVFSVTQATGGKLAGDTPTVGEFVVRYARTVGLAGDRTSAEDALGALRASGMVGTSPVSLDSRLTEGDVVRLTSSANLGIASRNASKEFTRVQTNTFFSVFGTSLKGSGGAGTVGASLNNPGHDKKDTTIGTNDCPPDTNPNSCKGVDPRTRGKGKKKGLSNHFPF